MHWLVPYSCFVLSVGSAAGWYIRVAWVRAIAGPDPCPPEVRWWQCRCCREMNVGDSHCLACGAPPPWPCECDPCAAGLRAGRYRVAWGEDDAGEMVR